MKSIKILDEIINKFENKNKYKFRRKISELKFSENGINLLAEYLEWSTFKARKPFVGCGNYLSMGVEYAIRTIDLDPDKEIDPDKKGIFFKAGLNIKDYLSDQFIDYLKSKNYKEYVKITKEEYSEWQECLIQELSKNDAIKLFATFIDETSKSLKDQIKVLLSQNEYDALICALYNIGFSEMKNIKLIEILNSGNRIGTIFALASIRAYRLNKVTDIYNYDDYVNCSKRWNNGNISEKELIKLANESNLKPQRFIYGWTKRDFIQANYFANKLFFNHQKKPSEVVENYLKNLFTSNNNIMKLSIFDNSQNLELSKNIVEMILKYTKFLDIMVTPLTQNITDKFWYTLKNGKHKSWIFTGKFETGKKNLQGLSIENLSNKYFENN